MDPALAAGWRPQARVKEETLKAVLRSTMLTSKASEPSGGEWTNLIQRDSEEVGGAGAGI